jgi:hypothetical protein
MAVMPKGADTEGPDAGHGEEQAAAEPHSDIVARLLEYQRRLREETGGEPAPFKEREASPPPIEERVPSDQSDASEESSEPEPQPAGPDPQSAEPDPQSAEPAPPPQVPADASSEPPDARQLKERIDRLDETLARISAMLPLLKGETKRDPDP